MGEINSRGGSRGIEGLAKQSGTKLGAVVPVREGLREPIPRRARGRTPVPSALSQRTDRLERWSPANPHTTRKYCYGRAAMDEPSVTLSNLHVRELSIAGLRTLADVDCHWMV